MNRAKLAGIVLAGGQSTRMGRDKALLKPFGELACTLLARSFALVASFSPVTYVASGRANYPAWPCLKDEIGQGPGAGIYAALKMAKRRGLAGVMTVACDLPMLAPLNLRYLHNAWLHANQQAVLYQDEASGKIEMLVAIYSVACLDLFETPLRLGHFSLKRIIPPEIMLTLPYGQAMKPYFMNCNTAEEFEKAKLLLGKNN